MRTGMAGRPYYLYAPENGNQDGTVSGTNPKSDRARCIHDCVPEPSPHAWTAIRAAPRFSEEGKVRESRLLSENWT